MARLQAPRTVRGNTLLVAIVLLLLASVVTMLTLNVGLFEQRASGNEARARLVAEVAEAGVAQGAAYFGLVPGALATASGHWARCADLSDRTQFPCGAIHDAQRRDTMYYWINADASGDLDGDGKHDLFDQRMLPLRNVLSADARITSVGGFDRVAYGVGVVLCRIAIPVHAGEPTRCTTTASEQGVSHVATFVSVASLPGEGARTTVSQMLGLAPVFRPNPRQPPLIASGRADLTGGVRLVAHPNGGGPGVPVSAWSRKDVTTASLPHTCQADAFYRDGAEQGAWPTIDASGVRLCDACGCSGDDSLSRDIAGHLHAEGMDILDVDGSDGANGQGMNADVVASEFPCDLFGYLFGTAARIDTDGDAFCETLAPAVPYTSPATMQTVSLDVDEAFLYQHATTIFPRDASAQQLMDPRQSFGAADPATLSGIVWCQVACDFGTGAQIGTPLKPVVLVIDGSATLRGRVFGIVFLRTPAATPAKHPQQGPHDHLADALDPSMGGNAVLRLGAGATVYGAVVVQGEVDEASASAAIIASAEVFQHFGNSIPPRTSNLPGAWSDRLRY